MHCTGISGAIELIRDSQELDDPVSARFVKDRATANVIGSPMGGADIICSIETIPHRVTDSMGSWTHVTSSSRFWTMIAHAWLQPTRESRFHLHVYIRHQEAGNF